MAAITWINEPPIVEIDDDMEFEALSGQFMRETMTWREPTTTDEQIKRWNARINRGIGIAGSAGEYIMRGGDDKGAFAYMLFGTPVGLMVTSKSKASRLIEVKFLTTHPGSESGGGILIEHAVNLSENAGYQGCLELEAKEASAMAYKALGFVATGGGNMKLVPSQSDKWVKVSQVWRLKKYAERQTFAGPATAIPAWSPHRSSRSRARPALSIQNPLGKR
jgi:hypothetical protein